MAELDETHVPHVGWLMHEPGDDVGRYLREGWFEFAEQALWWLYLRPGDCVIDCGAHVGLFTLLASQLVGERGRVLAIEPNPATAALLRNNVAAAGCNNVEVIEAAASSSAGTMTLHAGSGAHSAYSSSVMNVNDGRDLAVRAVTIDELIRERSIPRVAMLKIDVEGAELDVWRGCASAAGEGRIDAVMIEFTEANQQASGMSSPELAQLWIDSGYKMHRFDPATMTLAPATVDRAIEYENLYALRDSRAVGQRIAQAPVGQRRVAKDIVNHGAAAHVLLKRSCDVEHYRQLVDDLRARLDAALRECSELADDGQRAHQRARAYAAYIDRVIHSPAGRIARALRLAKAPDWLETMRKDLQ